MGREEDERDHNKVEQVLCMKGGDGETSYAKNSNLQRFVMSQASFMLEESVNELCSTFLFGHNHCRTMIVADLGCTTGPNALFAVLNIINNVRKICDDLGQKSPSFLLFLNDLPSNDFNNIFKSLSDFYDPISKNNR
uniref:Uncharacterized protein n=1 Tax=Kalanchoe fedtschenkoi TaxID=63787 RepID=A0A7N0T3I2_KALFE